MITTVFMHVGHSITFVGVDYEAAGFCVDDSGEPKSDGRGNTVAKVASEPIDPKNEGHQRLLLESYDPDGRVEDSQHYQQYLRRECGLSAKDARRLAAIAVNVG